MKIQGGSGVCGRKGGVTKVTGTDQAPEGGQIPEGGGSKDAKRCYNWSR